MNSNNTDGPITKPALFAQIATDAALNELGFAIVNITGIAPSRSEALIQLFAEGLVELVRAGEGNPGIIIVVPQASAALDVLADLQTNAWLTFQAARKRNPEDADAAFCNYGLTRQAFHNAYVNNNYGLVPYADRIAAHI